MSKRDRQCGHKRRYDSKDEAKHIKLKMMSSGCPPLNIYRCKYCGYWHLGNALRRR